MINIGILGYGTVGSGVVEVFNTNKESINKRAGKDINIKYVLDLRDFFGDPIQDKIVHDYQVIVNDPEINVVVELMGGVNPAYEFVKEALQKGKSVVTSNKELVAKHGAELLRIARDNKLNFLFEASVGGGIPIIRPLNQSLTADEIEEITGILNGTTNYILTKMSHESLDFQTVLKEAQDKGYAERNPDADVKGYDACRKIAILSSLAFGMQVDYEDIYTEGITEITDIDILYAKVLGRSVKLLASSKKIDGKIYAMVSPKMINEDHPLFSVNDVFNGIYVKGNVIGDVMFYGRGAGKLPTASAVVADIVDASKHLGTNIMTIWSRKKLEIADIKNSRNKFFIRIERKEGIEDVIKGLFGKVEVVTVKGIEDEYAFITEEITEAEYKDKVLKVGNVKNMIRVEG